MARNLILTGGLYHPFEAASETLRELLEPVGFESDITTDIHAGLSWLDDGGYDLLTVYALRWPMLAERFDNDRALWAVTLEEVDRQRIDAHLAAGKGLLALHTAAISFDDWPRWRDIVGAGWIWGTSYHPPHGPVQVAMTPRAHPITQGLQGFGFADEAYARMDLVSGIEPLATVQASVQQEPSPALWARELGSARVAYDALGHDSDSLNHPTHRRIVQRAALWATRQPDSALAAV
jgi:type 1 glutamine amidotransferase